MQNRMEDKKRVTVAIPMQLHRKLLDAGYGVTEAIIEGLELLLNENDTKTTDNSNSMDDGLLLSYQERIEDLKGQLNVKDTQIGEKDVQISELTKAMNAQAVHLQTVLSQKAIEAPGAKKPWWRFW